MTPNLQSLNVIVQTEIVSIHLAFLPLIVNPLLPVHVLPQQ